MRRRLVVALLSTLGVIALSPDASAGSVRAQGSVRYYEKGASGGNVLAFAGVRVKLKDDDGILGTTTLKTGYTNSTGGFDLSATADDGWFQGKLDPFIQVELEGANGKIVVESEILKINVTCSTAVRSETEGTINFGNIACGGDGKDASAIFAHIKTAYDKFTQLTGQGLIPRHNGKAAALFPATFASGVPWTTEESIHWPGGFRDFKGAYHEFGHRIRHAQDGDFAHFLADVVAYSYPQHHSYDKVTNEGFAFNEGWAEYNATLSNPTEKAGLEGWRMLANGANNIEGNVAAKLTKMSAVCGGFPRMWSTLQSGIFHKYSEFANKLKADFNANASLRSQFPQCVPSIVAALTNDRSLDAAPLMVAGNGVAGAFAPVNKDDQDDDARPVSPALQQAMLSGMADRLRARSVRFKPRNRFALNVKLKGVGDGLVAEREGFEKRAVDRLEKHLRQLKLHDGSKEAIEARRQEHAAFLKGVLLDRAASVEKQIAQIASARGKHAAGPEAAALDKMKARAEALVTSLKQAAQTGTPEEDLLPNSFFFSAEASP